MNKETRIRKYAATWRKSFGNYLDKSRIKTGRFHDGIKADDVKNEIIRQTQLSITRSTTQYRLSVRNVIFERIRSRLYTIIDTIPEIGYSMGDEYNIVLYFGKDFYISSHQINAIKDTRRNYQYGKYRSTWGYVSIHLSVFEYRNIHIINNIPTIIDPEFKNEKIKAVTWFQATGKKQYYKLNKINGYLIDSKHFTEYTPKNTHEAELINKIKNKRTYTLI